jgi:hypothetical protein
MQQNKKAMDVSPYQLALLFNNHGVQQLERGDFHNARRMFLGAMEEIKLSLPESDQGLVRHIANANKCVKWSGNAHLHGEMNIPSIASTSFFFRRALIIEPNSDEHLPSPDFEMESTVIIYNCALSLLIDGFVTNTSNLLTISQQLFEIALAIRERYVVSQSHPDQLYSIILDGSTQSFVTTKWPHTTFAPW